MSTIRRVEEEDVEAVLAFIRRWVASSVYQSVLPDPATHDDQLMFAARHRGVALAAVDDQGVVVGCLIAPIHDYMGSSVAEEVAFFADSPRDLIRLFHAGERLAVQKGANVLKMSAPRGSDLGGFYFRQGYQTLETVFVKVLHGMGERRNRSGGPDGGGDVGLREEEERAGQGRS